MKQEQIQDIYKSVSATAKGIYKDKGSKFIAFVYPIESEADVKSILATLKKEYFDAKHHCYAYRLGYDGSTWRYNDDGEPSSTAGRPIFGQILSNELSDILIVIVRYFGGIKLGVPGLIKAYKSAAADAISNATIIEKTAKKMFTISFGYDKTNTIMKILKEMNISPSKQSFDNECVIELPVRLRDIDGFINNIEQSGAILIENN